MTDTDPSDASAAPVGALLSLRAAPGRGDELAELIRRMVDVTNRLHDPIYYGASRTAADPESFVVHEVWSDRAAVDAHLAAPEYQALNREAAERGLLVDADDVLRLAPIGPGPIRGMQLHPILIGD